MGESKKSDMVITDDALVIYTWSFTFRVISHSEFSEIVEITKIKNGSIYSSHFLHSYGKELSVKFMIH